MVHEDPRELQELIVPNKIIRIHISLLSPPPPPPPGIYDGIFLFFPFLPSFPLLLFLSYLNLSILGNSRCMVL